jgi:hypothetical protein
MLLPSKKTHVSCLTLLGDLAETSLHMTAHPRNIGPGRVGTLTIPGVSANVGEGEVNPLSSAELPTPMGGPGLGFGYRGPGTARAGAGAGALGQLNVNGNSPPDAGYLHSQIPMQMHQSRWKEDWEELELLVSCHLPDCDMVDSFYGFRGKAGLGPL